MQSYLPLAYIVMYASVKYYDLSIIRYKFLILDIYRADTIFTWASIEGFMVIFRGHKGSTSKEFGKHWSI